ncbi:MULTISPECIES: sensor histidine kinase [Actinomadura]|uniref:Sensor histidine kinase n=1 Tax=Actinomadura yumaensis TaxID=111807 RepID=A0ABW2CC02_9ACTN|nr:ATP-binding protein [Actinomadura sp. J1-007]MWK38217.1 ATP-binding protein [Actinomadura sp. J1-007]
MPGVQGTGQVGPAQAGVERRTAHFMVALRLSSSFAGGVAALLGATLAQRPGLAVACGAGLMVWGGAFSLLVLTRGPRTGFVVGDVAVTAVLCLLHRQLVPDEVLGASAGTGWVDIVASSAVFLVQFGARQPFGTVATGCVVAAYVLGAPGWREAPAVLVLQGLLAAALVGLLRREARAADRGLAAQAEAAARAAAQSATRADERDQQRRLHDTVLATLTMVGAGGITGPSPVLARRAAADLAVIESLATGGPDSGRARLDVALRAAVQALRPGLPQLRVDFAVPPCELPRRAVAAIAQSAQEALTNIARHAGTASARIESRRTESGVRVEIGDEGRGFDVAAVPAQRRGLNESVRGRMAAAGGGAEIDSRPGGGTRVRLWWPDGR